MKNKIALIAALASAATLVSETASARSSTYETRDEDKCYVSAYIPNLVEENTRGRLYRSEQRFVNNGVRDRESGGIVRSGTEPAQYIKTQRIVEREHYTLTPSNCPPR